MGEGEGQSEGSLFTHLLWCPKMLTAPPVDCIPIPPHAANVGGE